MAQRASRCRRPRSDDIDCRCLSPTPASADVYAHACRCCPRCLPATPVVIPLFRPSNPFEKCDIFFCDIQFFMSPPLMFMIPAFDIFAVDMLTLPDARPARFRLAQPRERYLHDEMIRTPLSDVSAAPSRADDTSLHAAPRAIRIRAYRIAAPCFMLPRDAICAPRHVADAAVMPTAMRLRSRCSAPPQHYAAYTPFVASPAAIMTMRHKTPDATFPDDIAMLTPFFVAAAAAIC